MTLGWERILGLAWGSDRSSAVGKKGFTDVNCIWGKTVLTEFYVVLGQNLFHFAAVFDIFPALVTSCSTISQQLDQQVFIPRVS